MALYRSIELGGGFKNLFVVSCPEYDEFWAVERILRMRKREGNREFKIRWKGFSWRFDAWVGEDDLLEPLMEFPMSATLKRKIKRDTSN